MAGFGARFRGDGQQYYPSDSASNQPGAGFRKWLGNLGAAGRTQDLSQSIESAPYNPGAVPAEPLVIDEPGGGKTSNLLGFGVSRLKRLFSGTTSEPGAYPEPTAPTSLVTPAAAATIPGTPRPAARPVVATARPRKTGASPGGFVDMTSPTPKTPPAVEAAPQLPDTNYAEMANEDGVIRRVYAPGSGSGFGWSKRVVDGKEVPMLSEGLNRTEMFSQNADQVALNGGASPGTRPAGFTDVGGSSFGMKRLAAGDSGGMGEDESFGGILAGRRADKRALTQAQIANINSEVATRPIKLGIEQQVANQTGAYQQESVAATREGHQLGFNEKLIADATTRRGQDFTKEYHAGLIEEYGRAREEARTAKNDAAKEAAQIRADAKMKEIVQSQQKIWSDTYTELLKAGKDDAEAKALADVALAGVRGDTIVPGSPEVKGKFRFGFGTKAQPKVLPKVVKKSEGSADAATAQKLLAKYGNDPVKARAAYAAGER